jgi:hypothetical protein
MSPVHGVTYVSGRTGSVDLSAEPFLFFALWQYSKGASDFKHDLCHA